MRSYSGLFDQITSFDNFVLAASNARKGKRFAANVAAFDAHLESNLFKLQRELTARSYRPGRYKSFFIYDPKTRMISAAPYRDRVVHHALMNVTGPLFERKFIFDTYANRLGKGTHPALDRFQHYACRCPYVLKADIRKFFPSIDHEILKQEIRRTIRCPDTLWLIDRIIDNSNPQEAHSVYFPGDDLFTPQERRRGLPIGNLTSQWWGNVYLDRFDHFVKETLRVPGYIRYVDDFVLFGKSKKQLWEWRSAIVAFLAGLRLILHENKTQVFRVDSGVPFLGFRVYPEYRTVLKVNLRRYRRFLKKKLERWQAGDPGAAEQIEHGLNSWLGHVRYAQSKRLEYETYWYIRRHGVTLCEHPSGSWRVLEQ